jgi:hypothetical protein
MSRHSASGSCSSGVASTMLANLAKQAKDRDGLTIGEALDEMGRSGFGFIMLLLALPALIPIPGPFGMVFGSALAIVAMQFSFGARNLWLPAIIRNRRIQKHAFAILQRHADPIVRPIERRVRPGRMQALGGDRLAYLLGLPVFVLAVAVALPIPFGNLLPVAAICLMALGMIERDGLVVLLGLLLTAIALMVTLVLLYGAASLFAAM